jgi:hypothetical protein
MKIPKGLTQDTDVIAYAGSHKGRLIRVLRGVVVHQRFKNPLKFRSVKGFQQ